jgi:phosphatidylglycerophosphatase A
MVESKRTRHRLLLWLGSIGPLGHMPASGTVTVAVVGVPGYYLMHAWPMWVRIAVVVVFTGASVRLHDVGDRLLGEKDSRKLVWDELVGYWIAVLPAAAFTWQIAAVTFFLERIIDIVKVPPANAIERRWRGGWGVVGDDVIAGLYTAIILAACLHFVPDWMGIALTS